GGLPVVVIRDDLAAARPATFQFLLHALEPMAVDGDARRLTIRNGAVRCRVDFLEPTALTFDQHDRFPEAPFRPAPNQWHLTAGTTTPATAAASLIVLQPYRDRDEDRLLTPRLHAGSAGPALVLAAPGRTVTVLLPGPDERPLRLGDLEAHGRWASLTLCDSQPRSAVLVGGRQLTWQGRDLLTGDRTATLSCTRWPDGRRLIEATATPGTNLTAALGTPEAWQQHADGPELRWQPGPEPLREAALALDAQAQRPFTIGRLPRLQQVTARADAPAFDGHAALDLTLANHGQGPLPISVRGGRTPALSRVLPGGAEETLHLPAVDLAGGAELVVTADESGAGRLGRLDATARPVTGVNLLPTALLENPANPATRTWQATSISGSARGEVAVLPDGREGRPCLKVTCIDPGTNGTFGAILRWPGLQPARRDRHFRMSCWVRTPPDAVAGLQVTSRDWSWWKNTERLGDRPAWTETALEFTLPAGTDLTHVRLHMTSQRPGAELFAADMALIELPAPPPAE
ncbi:MAG: hypothetical protein GX595_07935, partial [Lentisphaerae bacterium]|nr:hypothetical protein [Lentisphaerota bacterium]